MARRPNYDQLWSSVMEPSGSGSTWLRCLVLANRNRRLVPRERAHLDGGQGTVRRRHTQSKAWAASALDGLWQSGPKRVLEWFDATQPGSTEAAEVLKRERGTSAATRVGCSTHPCASKHLPIGSGAVKASAKHLVQHRMKRNGSRWSDLGARAILDLRCHLLSGRPFDRVASLPTKFG